MYDVNARCSGSDDCTLPPHQLASAHTVAPPCAERLCGDRPDGASAASAAAPNLVSLRTIPKRNGAKSVCEPPPRAVVGEPLASEGAFASSLNLDASDDLANDPPARRRRRTVQRIRVDVVAKTLRRLVKLIEDIPPSLGTEASWGRAHGAATTFRDDMAFLLSDNAPGPHHAGLKDRAGSRVIRTRGHGSGGGDQLAARPWSARTDQPGELPRLPGGTSGHLAHCGRSQENAPVKNLPSPPSIATAGGLHILYDVRKERKCWWMAGS